MDTDEKELNELDAAAAAAVDGWTDVWVRKHDGGVYSGMPRKGLRRPVIGYSRDLRRATQLVRRAVRFHGAVQNDAHVNVVIENDEVTVTAWNPSTATAYNGVVERTDALPELLVRAALHLVVKQSKGKK